MIAMTKLTGTCPVPLWRNAWGPCLPAGRKGHNTNNITLSRPNGMAGELHNFCQIQIEKENRICYE